MGLLDTYTDAMQKLGHFMKTADPFGPVGQAGEAVSDLFSTVEMLREDGVDSLWNAASDLGEVESVAQSTLPRAKQTHIIAGALSVVLAMQYQCGWTNKTEDGDGYGQSAQRFNEIADGLETAFPNANWIGDASDAYAAANEAQKRRARRMPDADLDVLMAISSEANTVNNTRRILNAATVMGNAIAPALAARAIPRVGKGISLGIETSVVGVCLPTCIWYMNELSEHSARSARSMDEAALIYEQIAAECYPTQM
ncbi:hypothetical protein A5666_12495 [Mycolicibacterium fortuitum]|uniref:EspA/EspE family type VII secretion system effector n=1 Tax=Mycolicibacterium fortuitum TaxID=1766 RepID=UPI0007EBEDE9|nr:EspA/EspE family type VII secretion system effector [Mycolicibacterium fortuitum]OBA91976.1 hypothetical protein A5665_01225 [Mycolicibacterium fortuitum]OBI61942.1 hypothetical protein A5666_12495 [Mycolicibacterium fortuitum]